MADKFTITDLSEAKRAGRKIVAVSCYDYTTASLVARAGVDIMLVGDSAAQVLLGHDSTLPVNMDFMVEITAAVRRAAPDSCLVADMPFLSCNTGIYDAVVEFILPIRVDGFGAFTLQTPDHGLVCGVTPTSGSERPVKLASDAGCGVEKIVFFQLLQKEVSGAHGPYRV